MILFQICRDDWFALTIGSLPLKLGLQHADLISCFRVGRLDLKRNPVVERGFAQHGQFRVAVRKFPGVTSSPWRIHWRALPTTTRDSNSPANKLVGKVMVLGLILG